LQNNIHFYLHQLYRMSNLYFLQNFLLKAFTTKNIFFL
jgi:hypothetical protein